jgi:transposase
LARGRTYTREFELLCCRQVATGQRCPAQVCREHNLLESMLLRWRKEYDARGEEAAFTEKQLSQTETLEKRIRRTREVLRQARPGEQDPKKGAGDIASAGDSYENAKTESFF